jgi:hypothetical protein
MGNQVFVTNKNKEVHSDRYDGEDYVFPPGEPVLMSYDSAVHCFGYQLVDKTDTLVRLGWAMKYDVAQKTYVENAEGIARLAHFVFDEAVMTPRSKLAEGVKPDAVV